MTDAKGAPAPGFQSIEQAVASLTDSRRRLMLAGRRLREANLPDEALIVEKSAVDLAWTIALLREPGDG